MMESKTEVEFRSLAMQEIIRPASAGQSSGPNKIESSQKRTFKVNFNSQAEMLSALRILREARPFGDGLQFTV